jgi:chromosome segregation ATPase
LINNSNKNGGNNDKKTSQSQTKNNRPEEAYVIIGLRLSDESLLELKRSVNKGNESFYYVKGVKCQKDDYDALLRRNQIISNINNFLMLQSDTDTLVSKSPEALTEYFERVSGSFDLKKDYDVVKKEHDNVQAKIKELSGLLSSLKAEKKKLRAQLENNKEYEKLTKEITYIETQSHLIDFFEIDMEIDKNLMEYDSIKTNYDAMRQRREELLDQQKNIEEEKLNRKKELRMLDDEIERRKIDLRTHRQKALEIDEEIKFGVKSNKSKENHLNDLR